ncbi:glutamic acid-rich protein-like [Sitophilus oryzae]|uniref:Glutamic acid-rich protein-like n=1 Tax=Sitophilus oryzae TaxID=7048 RepID=A0A6J2X3G2_SITOR|nr:glutamic acid-rich protein-like [Sitophilus oryzae]
MRNRSIPNFTHPLTQARSYSVQHNINHQDSLAEPNIESAKVIHQHLIDYYGKKFLNDAIAKKNAIQNPHLINEPYYELNDQNNDPYHVSFKGPQEEKAKISSPEPETTKPPCAEAKKSKPKPKPIYKKVTSTPKPKAFEKPIFNELAVTPKAVGLEQEYYSEEIITPKNVFFKENINEVGNGLPLSHEQKKVLELLREAEEFMNGAGPNLEAQIQGSKDNKEDIEDVVRKIEEHEPESYTTAPVETQEEDEPETNTDVTETGNPRDDAEDIRGNNDEIVDDGEVKVGNADVVDDEEASEPDEEDIKQPNEEPEEDSEDKSEESDTEDETPPEVVPENPKEEIQDTTEPGPKTEIEKNPELQKENEEPEYFKPEELYDELERIEKIVFDGQKNEKTAPVAPENESSEEQQEKNDKASESEESSKESEENNEEADKETEEEEEDEKKSEEKEESSKENTEKEEESEQEESGEESDENPEEQKEEAPSKESKEDEKRRILEENDRTLKELINEDFEVEDIEGLNIPKGIKDTDRYKEIVEDVKKPVDLDKFTSFVEDDLDLDNFFNKKFEENLNNLNKAENSVEEEDEVEESKEEEKKDAEKPQESGEEANEENEDEEEENDESGEENDEETEESAKKEEAETKTQEKEAIDDDLPTEDSKTHEIIQPHLHSGGFEKGLQVFDTSRQVVTVPFDYDYSGSQKTPVQQSPPLQSTTPLSRIVKRQVKEIDWYYKPEKYDPSFTYVIPEPNIPDLQKFETKEHKDEELGPTAFVTENESGRKKTYIRVNQKKENLYD